MKSVKQTIRISTAFMLLGIVISSGCKKGSNPSPVTPKASQAAFGVMSDLSPANAAAASVTHTAVNSTTTGPVITFTSGIANVTRFELEAKRNGIDTKFETRNLMNVNLFTTNPTFINTPIDTGTYKEIEVRLVLTQTSTGPIPLVLGGTVSTPAGVVPFEFDFNENLEIKAEANNVTVTKSQSLKAIFLLHLNMVLNTITNADIAAATLTDGKIVVNAHTNTAIFNKITASLANIGETRIQNENGDDNDNGDNDNSGQGSGNGNNGGSGNSGPGGGNDDHGDN
jgi:uncharacterized membrane protein YgcG